MGRRSIRRFYNPETPPAHGVNRGPAASTTDGSRGYLQQPPKLLNFWKKQDFHSHAEGHAGGQDGLGHASSQTGSHTGTMRQVWYVRQYGSILHVVFGTHRVHFSSTIRQVVYGT